MSKRQEPKRKTPADVLQDLRTGHQEANSHGPSEAQRYLEKVLSAEEEEREFKAYLPELRFCERGIALLADTGEIEQALGLCDLALELGLGRAYESKRQSLERRL